MRGKLWHRLFSVSADARFAWLRLSAGCLLALLLACSSGAGEAQQTEQSETAAKDPRENMVRVPAGSFLYGATDSQTEFYIRRSRFNFPGMIELLRKRFVAPQRSETLGDYYIHLFEVTNQEYAAFLEATGYRPASKTDFLKHWESGRYPDWAATFPVVWVSRSDASAYCEWIGGRLPSEKEWEKAARGSDGRFFPWGDVMPSPETANYGSQALEPAGNRPQDVSPHGVYDMAGNVAEWTSSTTQEGAETFFIVRGGSYNTRAREMLTCHRDFVESGEVRRENIGFRCAAD